MVRLIAQQNPHIEKFVQSDQWHLLVWPLESKLKFRHSDTHIPSFAALFTGQIGFTSNVLHWLSPLFIYQGRHKVAANINFYSISWWRSHKGLVTIHVIGETRARRWPIGIGDNGPLENFDPLLPPTYSTHPLSPAFITLRSISRLVW